MTKLFKHYLIKFFIRLGITMTIIVVYFLNKEYLNFTMSEHNVCGMNLMYIFWAILVVEMLIQINPKSKVSMGCLKQFGKFYQPAEKECDEQVMKAQLKEKNFGALRVLIVWVGANLIFGGLYWAKIIGVEELVVLSALYYIGDLVCVVFLCPFQRLFMKNRCCNTCRIFAWAHFMMTTPLLFVPHFYSWSLFALAIVMLFRWEYTYHKHPERFLEITNERLKCKNCTDKLCKIRNPVVNKKGLSQ